MYESCRVCHAPRGAYCRNRWGRILSGTGYHYTRKRVVPAETAKTNSTYTGVTGDLTEARERAA